MRAAATSVLRSWPPLRVAVVMHRQRSRQPVAASSSDLRIGNFAAAPHRLAPMDRSEHSQQSDLPMILRPWRAFRTQLGTIAWNVPRVQEQVTPAMADRFSVLSRAYGDRKYSDIKMLGVPMNIRQMWAR